MKNKSPRELVLKYYPKAFPLNIGCKKGNKKYYQIVSENQILGKGKSKLNAWTAAWRNINY